MVLIYMQPSVADKGWIMVMVTPECVILTLVMARAKTYKRVLS
jgi:hypothetical protein